MMYFGLLECCCYCCSFLDVVFISAKNVFLLRLVTWFACVLDYSKSYRWIYRNFWRGWFGDFV